MRIWAVFLLAKIYNSDAIVSVFRSEQNELFIISLRGKYIDRFVNLETHGYIRMALFEMFLYIVYRHVPFLH